MSLLSTLVACCGSSNGSSSVSKKDTKTLVVGLVRENKIGRSGRIDGKSGRQAVQWRPALCTISEDDVIKAEMIQVFVMPYSPDIEPRQTIQLAEPSTSPYRSTFTVHQPLVAP
ncbi:hypothetical protein E3N88_37203 [Mikania micrantha]|uniref:Uncharacterized protein n=1 Tax=Mikania micrantha TaxID=192012 RepID=A0A5N6M8I6_9ASTR|nr:hypothetical protein E3N88_37203 [Mikania micrantha]